MKKTLCTLLFMLLVLLTLPAWCATQKWNYYENARFGYSIKYPDEFVKIKESDNGDGIWLEAKDGKSQLTFSGGYNVLMQDGADIVGSHNLDGLISGESGSDWFRIIRQKGSKVFYEYGKINDDVWASFTISYPKTKSLFSIFLT